LVAQLQIKAVFNRIEKIWAASGASTDFTTIMRQALPQRLIHSRNPQLHWSLLPVLCCGAAGGDAEDALDISAAWLLFYVAAHIFDNVEDLDEPEAWYADIGPGAAINAGCGLFFTASLALNELYQKPEVRNAAGEINRVFQLQMMAMSSGQHLDLILSQINLDTYWEIAEGKSGAFFARACWAGARLISDDNQQLDSYKQYGKHLGLLLQLMDDLRDIRPPAGEYTLPEPGKLSHSFAMAYALTVFPEAQRIQLLDLLARSAHNLQAARQVLETLQNSGVDLYLLTEIEKHRRLALQALENAHPVSPYRETLLSMLPDLRSK